MARRASDARPILCAVLDGDALGDAPRARAEALFAAGVDWIQLRDRARSAAELLALARALVAARDAGGRGIRRVIVNKRADLALAAGADGFHLGVDAIDPQAAAALAAICPAAALIGLSCHDAAEIEAAARADLPPAYAHLAPIWDPRSKPAERPALGLGELGRAARLGATAGIRVLAQGGIDPARAAAAVVAGAAGVAVTGLIRQAADPAEAARALRHALDAAPAPPAVAPAAAGRPR